MLLTLCRSVKVAAMPSLADFFKIFSKKKEDAMQDRANKAQREKDKNRMMQELNKSFTETQTKLRAVK